MPYNRPMLYLLIKDPMVSGLLCLIAATLIAWASGLFVYPFGILVLVSLLLARSIHLVGIHTDSSGQP